jgi:hypothetical protein
MLELRDRVSAFSLVTPIRVQFTKHFESKWIYRSEIMKNQFTSSALED